MFSLENKEDKSQKTYKNAEIKSGYFATNFLNSSYIKAENLTLIDDYEDPPFNYLDIDLSDDEQQLSKKLKIIILFEQIGP